MKDVWHSAVSVRAPAEISLLFCPAMKNWGVPGICSPRGGVLWCEYVVGLIGPRKVMWISDFHAYVYQAFRHSCMTQAALAEWSKAPVSGTGLRARVRIPRAVFQRIYFLRPSETISDQIFFGSFVFSFLFLLFRL
jgi:hypothetical protein